MMPFFQPELTGACSGCWAGPGLVYRPCVVGSGIGPLLLIDRLWIWYSSTRTRKKEGGSARASPVAARCLSQFLSERKDRMLRLLSIGVPFTDGVALYL